MLIATGAPLLRPASRKGSKGEGRGMSRHPHLDLAVDTVRSTKWDSSRWEEVGNVSPAQSYPEIRDVDRSRDDDFPPRQRGSGRGYSKSPLMVVPGDGSFTAQSQLPGRDAAGSISPPHDPATYGQREIYSPGGSRVDYRRELSSSLPHRSRPKSHPQRRRSQAEQERAEADHLMRAWLNRDLERVSRSYYEQRGGVLSIPSPVRGYESGEGSASPNRQLYERSGPIGTARPKAHRTP